MRGFVNRRTAFILTLLLLGVTAVAPAADKESEKKADHYELMKEFVTIFEQIEKNYVKDIDRRELLEAAITGMMKKLDPYSAYIPPKNLERFNRDVDQKFGGIGIQVRVDPDSNRLTVTTPLPGSPAYKGGVKAGDVIEEIEGKSTKGFTLDDAIKLMKGEPGEPVTIGVRHLGSKKIEKIRLVRAIIEIDTVRGDVYNADGTWNFFLNEKKKIGYIRLTHFSRHSSSEMRAALRELKKDGMKSLVLDLRNNPGGLLSQAIEIADMFIDKGKIVSVKGKNTAERSWSATKSGTYTGFPMAVLINRYSASASEILSACLQDHKRAVVIGERSWGKGSVQNVIQIRGSSSALKLTTASYHRPSGKNIHRFPSAKKSDEWGVMPDKNYRVRFSTAELLKFYDYRRDRDIISATGPPKSEFKDRQLAKALEYVAGGKPKKREATPAKKPAKAAKAGIQIKPKTDKDSTSSLLRERLLPLLLMRPRTLTL